MELRLPRLCGVILAAGASSRMGRDKALLPWPPNESSGKSTLLSAWIAALKPFTESVVVVASSNAEAIAQVGAKCGASVAINQEPERGQFSSMQIGLQAALDSGCDAAMVTPVDCPPLGEATLQLLRDAFIAASAHGKWAVAPENNGRRGHPLLAGRELIETLLRAPAAGNAREVMKSCTERFEYVPVPEPLLGLDMNTPEQYAALTKQAGAEHA